MKKTLWIALTLTLVLVIGSVAVGESALDAFNSLVTSDVPTFGTDATQLLDDAVNGTYNTDALGFVSAETLAADLEALSAISASEISSYAATNGLPVAQVRNAYYRALAGALDAEIETNPASEDKYRNIQTILDLFLDHETDVTSVSERQSIRSTITRTNIEQIAQDYQLPVSFVEFLILDDDWYDDLWENDDDWQDETFWYTGAVANELRIGSRDSASSSDVAVMQQELIRLNYLSGKADGIFGPRTESALIEFQMANGLTGSGIYDAATSRVLNSGTAVARTDYVEDFYAGYSQSSSSGSSSGSKSSTSKSSGSKSSGSSSNKYVDRTPDNTPDRTPDNTPDKTPDRTPDKTPDRT